MKTMKASEECLRLQRGERPSLRRWTALTLVAFGGSAFFGASLGVAIPGWDLVRGAWWLTLSAGTGWVLLGPSLTIATRKRPVALAEACLWAMAVGEMILAMGAVLNFALGHAAGPVIRNVGVVAVSNVAMAATLSRQLRPLGIPTAKVVTLWLLALDGGGGIAFWLLYGALFGGRR